MSKKVVKVVKVVKEESKEESKKESIDFENNPEFCFILDMIQEFIAEINLNNCTNIIVNPKTSINQRQYYSGILSALIMFERKFNPDKDIEFLTDKPVSIFKLYDILEQYENWKEIRPNKPYRIITINNGDFEYPEE